MCFLSINASLSCSSWAAILHDIFTWSDNDSIYRNCRQTAFCAFFLTLCQKVEKNIRVSKCLLSYTSAYVIFLSPCVVNTIAIHYSLQRNNTLFHITRERPWECAIPKSENAPHVVTTWLFPYEILTTDAPYLNREYYMSKLRTYVRCRSCNFVLTTSEIVC